MTVVPAFPMGCGSDGERKKGETRDGRERRGWGETRNSLVSSQSVLVSEGNVHCGLPVVLLGQRISCKSYGSAPIKVGITWIVLSRLMNDPSGF